MPGLAKVSVPCDELFTFFFPMKLTIDRLTGDTGSPVYTETSVGRTIIAIMSVNGYDCGPKRDFSFDGRISFAAIEPAIEWILEKLAEYSRYFCLEKFYKAWMKSKWTASR